MPSITDTFHARTRPEWRAWLAAHHEERDEIWLVGYRKGTGVASVAYNDAVEEALCFGWIDSIRKAIDDRRWAQRYTPRRPGSGYSQLNRERLARLLADDRVIPTVGAELARMRPEEIDPEAFRVPADIEAALRADPSAWEHWQRFSPAYRRIRAAYVDQVRDQRPDAFRKRLDHLVARTSAGRQFGYGIESYY